jgi:hypothetical protein
MVQTCKKGLRNICLIKNKEDWDLALPYIAMGDMMFKHASLSHFSPYFLLCGRHPIPPSSINCCSNGFTSGLGSAELGLRRALPTSSTIEGRARSPGIRIGRGTSRSSLNLHPKQTTKWLVHIPGHPWVLGQATGTLDQKTHHGPDSGEATTFPHIVFSTMLRGDYIQMALFPGTPKLESWNCPETVPVGIPGLWMLITPDYRVWSQRGLNQTCSPRQDLSNAMSHSQFGGWEEVDSRLLVVGSQIASLTLGLSFAHNLGNRCPNGQCKDIFDIYASRPFQWHQENLNARCLGPCYRTLNIRESRRTPTLEVLGFTPTLGQSGVTTHYLED